MTDTKLDEAARAYMAVDANGNKISGKRSDPIAMAKLGKAYADGNAKATGDYHAIDMHGGNATPTKGGKKIDWSYLKNDSSGEGLLNGATEFMEKGEGDLVVNGNLDIESFRSVMSRAGAIDSDPWWLRLKNYWKRRPDIVAAYLHEAWPEKYPTLESAVRYVLGKVKPENYYNIPQEAFQDNDIVLSSMGTYANGRPINGSVAHAGQEVARQVALSIRDKDLKNPTYINKTGNTQLGEGHRAKLRLDTDMETRGQSKPELAIREVDKALETPVSQGGVGYGRDMLGSAKYDGRIPNSSPTNKWRFTDETHKVIERVEYDESTGKIDQIATMTFDKPVDSVKPGDLEDFIGYLERVDSAGVKSMSMNASILDKDTMVDRVTPQVYRK